jgi:hypothetical protein
MIKSKSVVNDSLAGLLVIVLGVVFQYAFASASFSACSNCAP